MQPAAARIPAQPLRNDSQFAASVFFSLACTREEGPRGLSGLSGFGGPAGLAEQFRRAGPEGIRTAASLT